MKTLIVGLNSKYIHSMLAPWYLKAVCENECGDVKVVELTINDSMDSILAVLYNEKPDIVAFSCYIWNIEYVLKLTENLKKVHREIRILLGGPEVSYDSIQIMQDNAGIDYILAGEGELACKQLLKLLAGNISMDIGQIAGLHYRKNGIVIKNEPCNLIENLNDIPSPYTDEMLESVGNRIVYYESSRGCPFSCSYCISSTFNGVRYFSLDRVKRDLSVLISTGVRLVKFVDRTFNCNKDRAKEIFDFIIENSVHTVFHFEAAADLFDNEMLNILTKAPQGLIQFEIGIQSTNERTLEAIERKTSIDKVFNNIIKLKDMGNINLHLDLIAGLPYEGYDSFVKSFNAVYGLKPHQLQLGFLKMLKGSKIRKEADLYGYEYRNYPPYEILSNQFISFDEILELKEIEDIIDRYYNSGRFVNTLEYMVRHVFSSAFVFYHSFFLYRKENGYDKRAPSSRELYTVLLEFCKKCAEDKEDRNVEILSNELLKLDFLSSDNSGNLPIGIKRMHQDGFKEYCFDFLKDSTNIEKYLPGFKNYPAKQIYKQVHFELFDYNFTEQSPTFNYEKRKTIVLFNYSIRNKVNGLYEYFKIGN